MKPALSLLAILVFVLPAGGSPHDRRARQVWSFPGEEEPSSTSRFDIPTRRPVTTTTTRGTPMANGNSTTMAPGVIFQIEGCSCPAPPQYNPVCGSDGNTYSNIQRLNCARQCGSQVQISRMGVCTTPRK